MFVIKRNGAREEVDARKIEKRIREVCAAGVDQRFVDCAAVARKVANGLYNGVTTVELDVLTMETAHSMATQHPDYTKLAGNIAVSHLHKTTPATFSAAVAAMHAFVNPATKKPAPMVSDALAAIVVEHAAHLDGLVRAERDYQFDFFGIKTLENGYLLRIDGRPVETPQYMYMRVALGIHGKKLAAAEETYDLLSRGLFTHATPTLFNAGTPRPQLSSCFLLDMRDDSIDGIYETLRDCANISKSAGGIGLNIHCIRASGAHITGTNGTSNGIVPMLKVFNHTARYVDQCFAPDTPVYTDIGPVRIADIKEGRCVLADDGSFQPVTARVEHDVHHEVVLKVHLAHTDAAFLVTGKHQMLAVQTDGAIFEEGAARTRLDAGTLRAKMIDANDLRARDYVCFPVPRREENASVFTTTCYTLDDMRMWAFMLLAGIVHISTQPAFALSMLAPGGTCKNPGAVLLFAEDYLKKRGVKTWRGEDVGKDNVVRERLTWFSQKERCGPGHVLDWMQLSTGSADRRVLCPALYDVPTELAEAFIAGLLEISGGRLVGGGHVINLSTASQLVEPLWQLLLMHGRMPFWREVGPDHVRLMYDHKIDNSVGECHGFIHGSVFYVRVDLIEYSEYSGKLYDLEVDGPHTYVTALGAVHNGGGKRKGSFAVYIEPWHADIEDFLDLRKNTGGDEKRARDLFYGLWVPDLFMRRVEAGAQWTLFSPDQVPRLPDVHSDAFDALYAEAEREHPEARRIPAQELWRRILEAQTETGMPYMLYKDACNRKSNQQHLGTIRSSNLCTEIIEFTAPDETAVCNLASIALPKFVKPRAAPVAPDGDPLDAFDFDALAKVVGVAVANLNKIIDIEYYPTPEAERSNRRHRPIGLGVQGLADVFQALGLPFTSPAARVLNRAIFETIYFAALSRSALLAGLHGPYETYAGSPVSQGILQHDMWAAPDGTPVELVMPHDWASLRAFIARNGVRNSLLVAPMPTASTSQILGNNECFEPYTSNIYTRRTLAGEFFVVNRALVRQLVDRGLWSTAMCHAIMQAGGSVQDIPSIPPHLKAVFRTVWEIPQRDLIDMAADRAPFIDQSMSLNVFIAQPTFASLTSMHFHGWRRGLKTGMYYLRTRPAVDPIKFSLGGGVPPPTPPPDAQAAPGEQGGAPMVCNRDDPDCLACGS